jgi:hypothetical protein
MRWLIGAGPPVDAVLFVGECKAMIGVTPNAKSDGEMVGPDALGRRRLTSKPTPRTRSVERTDRFEGLRLIAECEIPGMLLVPSRSGLLRSAMFQMTTSRSGQGATVSAASSRPAENDRVGADAQGQRRGRREAGCVKTAQPIEHIASNVSMPKKRSLRGRAP